MISRTFCILAAVILFSCVGDRQNPYLNPDNVRIEEQSLRTLDGNLKTGTAYSCSVNIYLPSLVTSLSIRLSHSGHDSVFHPPLTADSSLAVFTFTAQDTGIYGMQIIVVKNNGKVDSLPAPKLFSVGRHIVPRITGFRPLGDSLLIQTAAYRCSVFVANPSVADSYSIVDNKDGKDSLVAQGKLISAFAADTGVIVFYLQIASPGKHQVVARVAGPDMARDSVVKSFVGRSIPYITPIASSYTAYLGDSIAVKFHVVSRDSNLLGYSTFLTFDLDSAASRRVDVMYPLISHVGEDTIVRKFKGKILAEGLTSPLICYAQAVDRSYAYSTVAACSIFVFDTISPRLKLLPPHSPQLPQTTPDSVHSLPDSIVVSAVDGWGVDSVTLNGARMVFVNDSVAKMTISSLPQGPSMETIIAWDKAGNTDTVFLKLAYGGPPTYPPKIRPLDKSVLEGHRFDTLFLDTCVIVTDPAIMDIAGYKASLVWSITDSAGNQVPTYNSTTRKLGIPVKPDSEWVDTFSLNFKVVASNGIDVRVGTFMINEVPDPPVMNVKTLQSKIAGAAFDTLFLDTCAKDPDNASSTLMWTFKNGKIFKVDSIFTGLRLAKSSAVNPVKPIFSRFTRKIAIVPIDTTKAGGGAWTGMDTLTFIVRDPGGLSQKKPVVFEKFSFKSIGLDTNLIKPIFQKLPKRGGD
jgi:hypothetical protein